MSAYNPDLDDDQVARLPVRERLVHVWRRWVYPRIHRDGYIAAELAYLENVMRGLETGHGTLESWRRVDDGRPAAGVPVDLWLRRWIAESDGWEWARLPGATYDPDGRCDAVPAGWRATWWMPVQRPPGLDGAPVDL